MKELLKKGNKKIYVWNGIGYNLDVITTNKKEISIEELAYICIKSGKGNFVRYSKAAREAIEQFENECYCYCDMSAFNLENGFLLIENLRSEKVEIYS